MAGRAAKLNCCKEEIISYLPLSHVAAQILDIYIPLLYAGTVCFAQPDALKVTSAFSYIFSCSILAFSRFMMLIVSQESCKNWV